MLTNRDLPDQFPVFWEVVTSFAHADLQNVEHLKQEVKKVDSDKSKILREEMLEIVEKGTVENKQLLAWYIFTCRYIDSIQIEKNHVMRSKTLDIEEEFSDKKQITESEVSALNNLCLV